MAGKANQYVNEYFLRFANETIVKEERREGMEYMVPSLIASQI
jgi:hypothetical protein